MKSVNTFNNLHNKKINREEIQNLINLAILEEQPHIAKRLQMVLNSNPGEEKFLFNIPTPANESIPKSMLNGIDYEEVEEEGLSKPVPASEIYQMITNKVIEMVKNSKDNYKRKWQVKGYMIPFNFVSKKRYRGVNHVMLTMLDVLENPFFLTFKQVNDLGGKIKKGSHGHPVIYFSNIYEARDSDRDLHFSNFDRQKVFDFAKSNDISLDSIITYPIIKYYNVYNGIDIEGIDFDLENFKIGYTENDIVASPKNKLKVSEAIIDNYPNPKPKLEFGGLQAFYSPTHDKVQMPPIENFDTIQDYYRTLFHEFSHSTGRWNRLDRPFENAFGSKEYAFEELVAELGSIFLCAEAGIRWHTNKNHAAYLKSWNRALTFAKDDDRFIMKASTQSQRIADFILQFDSMGDPLYLKELSLKKRPIEKTIKLINKEKKVKAKAVKKEPKKVVEVAKEPMKVIPKKVTKKKVAKIENDLPVIVEPETNQIALFKPEQKKEKKIKAIPVNADENSLAARLQNKSNVKREYYNIPDKDLAAFFGKVEKKNRESVAITIAGGQGSMKTRLCFQIMNCLGQNYKVGHASIEEHPESALYENKIHQYIKGKALGNISAPEINSIEDIHKLVRENDVIVIDSFSKLQEMQKGCELDKDFRKAYDGKLFIIIYQQTTDGKMRGGSKSQFDGDIICFVKKEANYMDNYCWMDKNRYQDKNLEDLKFNIYSGKLQQLEEEELQIEQEEIPNVEHKFNFQIQ